MNFTFSIFEIFSFFTLKSAMFSSVKLKNIFKFKIDSFSNIIVTSCRFKIWWRSSNLIVFFEILILSLKFLTLNLKSLKLNLNAETISMKNNINDRSKFDKKSFDFFDTSTILNCEFLFLFVFFVHVFINSKNNRVFNDILNQISYATIFLDIVEYWFEKQVVKFHCVLMTNVVHEWCHMIDIVSIFFVRCFIREFHQFELFFIENFCLNYSDIFITSHKFILFCKAIFFENQVILLISFEKNLNSFDFKISQRSKRTDNYV